MRASRLVYSDLRSMCCIGRVLAVDIVNGVEGGLRIQGLDGRTQDKNTKGPTKLACQGIEETGTFEVCSDNSLSSPKVDGGGVTLTHEPWWSDRGETSNDCHAGPFPSR